MVECYKMYLHVCMLFSVEHPFTQWIVFDVSCFLSLCILVVLHNSQVLLRGVETQGYVIVSASRAVIRSREHEPIWQGKQLKSKTTWVGKIEVMQVSDLDPWPWLGHHLTL